MTMNVNGILNGDLLFFLCAIAVAFLLGCAHRIGRSIARERRAVELADKDLRDLSSRYDLQQLNMSRLTRELSDVRQALMQQAMALGPVHAGLHARAAAAVPAPATTPAPTARQSAPAGARPAAQPSRPTQTPVPARAAPRPSTAKPAVKAAGRAPAPPATKPRRPAAADPLALARRGAGAEVLMSRCGLSRAEADLVISVHGKDAGSAAA